MDVKITLAQPHRQEAKAARAARGLDVFSNFEGPDFRGVENAHIEDGCVLVEVDSTTVYAYPLHTVARIKVTKK